MGFGLQFSNILQGTYLILIRMSVVLYLYNKHQKSGHVSLKFCFGTTFTNEITLYSSQPIPILFFSLAKVIIVWFSS